MTTQVRRDETIQRVYDAAAADGRAGEDPRLVSYLMNSWLRTLATIRGLPRV